LNKLTIVSKQQNYIKKNHNKNTKRKQRKSTPSRKVTPKKEKKRKHRHCASDQSSRSKKVSRSLHLTSWNAAIKIAKSKTNKCQDLKLKCVPMFNSPHMLVYYCMHYYVKNPWTNHIFQQLLIVCKQHYKEKFVKCKNIGYTCPLQVTNGGSKAFQSLFFKNDKAEKHCSSSTEPRTWMIIISTSLMYSRKAWQSTGCDCAPQPYTPSHEWLEWRGLT
jgi:hypothetical protein